MKKLIVFDPPMCCSTGVCGPVIDPALPRFAADLNWLVGQGIVVERYNLAQQPQAFVLNEAVKAELKQKGNACLPLILLDGQIVSRGIYPSREEIITLAGLEQQVQESHYTRAVEELVALGASIAANCDPCFRYHFDQARELGVSKEDMARAVKTAQTVKDTPARHLLELAERYLGSEQSHPILPILESDKQPAGKGCCS